MYTCVLLLAVPVSCLAQNSQQLYGEPANHEETVAAWGKLFALGAVPAGIKVSEASGDGYLLKIADSGVECGSLLVRNLAGQLHITYLKLYESAVVDKLCVELSAEMLGQLYLAASGDFAFTASTPSQYLGDRAVVQSFSRGSDGMVVHVTKLVESGKLLVIKVFHAPDSQAH